MSIDDIKAIVALIPLYTEDTVVREIQDKWTDGNSAIIDALNAILDYLTIDPAAGGKTGIVGDVANKILPVGSIIARPANSDPNDDIVGVWARLQQGYVIQTAGTSYPVNAVSGQRTWAVPLKSHTHPQNPHNHSRSGYDHYKTGAESWPQISVGKQAWARFLLQSGPPLEQFGVDFDLPITSYGLTINATTATNQTVGDGAAPTINVTQPSINKFLWERIS